MADAFLNASPIVIEGIGPRTEAALADAGVRTLADMLWRGARWLHHRVPGTSQAEIKGWLAAATLLQVDGVDPNVAEALVAAGIDTINRLAGVELETIERALAEAHERRRISRTLTLYELAAIQREAGRLRDTGMVTGRILEMGTDAPIAGVVVSAPGVKSETGADGRFHLVGVREGRARLQIRPPGRSMFVAHVPVRTGRLTPPMTVTFKPPRPEAVPIRAAHEARGDYIGLRPGDTTRIVEVSVKDLAEDTYLVVRTPRRDGTIRLVHLHRGKVGTEILTEVVDVQEKLLPRGASEGQIVQWHAGSLIGTTLTIHDVARKKFEAIIRRPLDVTARTTRTSVVRVEGSE